MYIKHNMSALGRCMSDCMEFIRKLINCFNAPTTVRYSVQEHIKRAAAPPVVSLLFMPDFPPLCTVLCQQPESVQRLSLVQIIIEENKKPKTHFEAQAAYF